MRILLAVLCLIHPLKALTVRVDYRFDTGNYFANPLARAALEAAAARWSRIMTDELLPIDLVDDQLDRRLAMFHPSTGGFIQLSVAAGIGSDYIHQLGGGAADFYLDGFSLEKDVWVIFVGAQDLPGSIAGRSGTITLGASIPGPGSQRDDFLVRGLEFLDLPLDLDATLPNSLTAVGGTVVADSETRYHFDLTAPPGPGEVDFYSVMLHEIGHTFGVCTRGVTQWRDLLDGNNYLGEHVIAAYEADTGLVGPLTVVGGSGIQFDAHFVDGLYQSKIFPLGGPNRVGTVPEGSLQDLLMESGSTIGKTFSRYEITNVDAAALKDMGWKVISEEVEAPSTIPLTVDFSHETGMRLIFESLPGETYYIQSSLTGRNWVNIQPPLRSDGLTTDWKEGQAGFFDPYGTVPESSRKVYRVVKP